MATQFTPVTTVSPTTVNDGGKLDEMIGLVQGLIQQRQQSSDQKYQTTVRNRQLQSFAEEDAQKEKIARQKQNFIGLSQAPVKDFDTKMLNDAVMNESLTQDQAKALLPYAKDYVSDEQRGLMFAEGLQSISPNDPVQLATLIKNTGVDETTARFYLGQLEKGGTGGGAGTGGGKPEPKDGTGQYELVGQAGGVNIKKLMRGSGMNFGNYRVKIYGPDLAPNAQLIDNDGNVFMKNKNGFYKKVKGGWKKINPEDDVKSSLNEAYTEWEKAHINSQGKKSTAISSPFEGRFSNE